MAYNVERKKKRYKLHATSYTGIILDKDSKLNILFLLMTEFDYLEQYAVDAAISANWPDAIAINKKILRNNKRNVQAYLRLGFAYMQTHKLDEAKKVYKKALKLQPANQLAQENLERIKILQARGSKKGVQWETKFDPNLFLEVPEKTKSVSLVTLGQKNTLAKLMIGQGVFLKKKRRKIEVRTKSNEYVGTLPDDLSKTLFHFTKGGNEYSAFIKEASLNRIVVFVREEKRGKKYAHFSSFPQDMQAVMDKISSEEDGRVETDDEDAVEGELENLAKNLEEDRDYLQFPRDGVEEDENLEE